MNLMLVVALLQGSQSVYHVSAAVDIPVTIGAAAATALPYVYETRLITPRCPCDPHAVNAFDRGAIGNKSAVAKSLSDISVGVVVVAPLVIDAIDLGGVNQAWSEDAVVFAQTLLVNGALVTATKYLVQRPLPRTYAGDPSLINRPEGYRSFYSGHTSLVFAGLSATAMTIRLRYGEQTWPWVVAGVLGTSVAVERVADGRHFPTDVIAAAVMGTAVGIVVPALHSRDLGPGASARRSQHRARGGGEGAGGLVVGWQLHF
ncbi:MAG TPA: phosphatase PAP2 family protein [Gemmatimonadales bacterium]|nr:phosphatase PAP2 family protein [Gemmatimonadales bacterium]